MRPALSKCRRLCGIMRTNYVRRTVVRRWRLLMVLLPLLLPHAAGCDDGGAADQRFASIVSYVAVFRSRSQRCCKCNCDKCPACMCTRTHTQTDMYSDKIACMLNTLAYKRCQCVAMIIFLLRTFAIVVRSSSSFDHHTNT